jgi:arginyl-tRNA synthetase
MLPLVKEQLHQRLEEAVRQVLDDAGGGELPVFSLEAPREKSHGDFACNAALLLSKSLRRPPREIAVRILERLGDAAGLIERGEVAGPGFVNVWLSRAHWYALLREILAAGDGYGSTDRGQGARFQVEFVSANPTGPLSLGHGRQAVLGDCIAFLLAATGFEVTREYYFNDGGRQMRVLGESVKSRYLEQLGLAAPPPAEALADPERAWVDSVGELPIRFPRDGYQGDYIGEIAATLRRREGQALLEEPAERLFRQEAERTLFEDSRATLERLDVHFDVFFNERSLYEDGRVEQTVAALRDKGLVYEADGAVWLRATALGHERDRVLVRSNGEPTYLLPDIAYHVEKFERGFAGVIDLQGADHIDQFPFVRSAAAALGCDPTRIELVMNQFVTLSSGGGKVKQSTRRATFVTVDELLPGTPTGRRTRPTTCSTPMPGALPSSAARARSDSRSRSPRIYPSRGSSFPRSWTSSRSWGPSPRWWTRQPARASRTTWPTTCATSRGSGIPTFRTGCTIASSRTTRS